MANNVILKEPLFYGKSDFAQAKRGVKAEDFIDRVEHFQRTSNPVWTDAVAVGHAISYLRDGAAQWFNKSLRVLAPADHARASNSFLAFKALFIRNFFEVKSVEDLGVDWHNLKQLERETVREFANRTFGVLAEYQLHVRHRPARQPILDAVRDASDAIRAAAGAQLVPQGLMQAQADAVAALHEAAAEDHISLMIQDFGKKLVADGVRAPKVREVVLRESRRETDMMTIVDLMEQAEQALSRREPIHNVKPTTSTTHAKGVAPVALANNDDDEDTQDQVAEVGTKKKKKPGNGKGGSKGNGNGAKPSHSNGNNGNSSNGGNGGGPRNNGHYGANQGPSAANGGASARPKGPWPCGLCDQMGHRLSDCPLKRSFISYASGSGRGASAVEDNDHFYNSGIASVELGGKMQSGNANRWL